MYRCPVTTETIRAARPLLPKDEARHLVSVLRAKPGTEVELFDGKGLTRRTRILEIRRGAIELSPEEECSLRPQTLKSLVLFTSVIKRIDWSVEKATEVGVSRIVPMLTERSVVKIPAKDAETKAERWRRVAEDSLRQCGGAWMPDILPPMPFAEALKYLPQCDAKIVAALSPKAKPLREYLPELTGQSVAYCVGPEGDFTPNELQALLDAGCLPASLGPRVLRAETASLYGLAVLSAALF